MSEQQENLDRVSARIGWAVCEFWREYIGRQYFAEDLHQAVLGKTGLIVAPASADRIMRDKRQHGAINYVVVSRHESLYRGLDLGEDRKKAKLIALRCGPVFVFIHGRGGQGATDDEIQVGLGMEKAAECCARTALRKAGLVELGEITRAARSGKQVAVWIAAEFRRKDNGETDPEWEE